MKKRFKAEHALNNRIKLQEENSKGIVIKSAYVWGEIKDVGAVTKLTAKTAGTKVDLTVYIYRYELKDFTHAVIEGERYNIFESGAAENNLYVKLILQKGD